MRTFLLLVLSVAASLAGLPVQVAVVSYGPTNTGTLITDELKKLEEVKVLHERLAWKPGRTESDLTDDDRRALGSLWKVDLLILVDAKGDAFAYVDAATGQELFRIREETPEALARSAYVLVEELRDVERAPKVFVTETPETSGPAGYLRDWLREAGMHVLEPAPAEQALPTKGVPPPAPDVMFQIHPSGTNFRIEVFSSRNSSLGRSPAWDGTSLPEPIREFLVPFLKCAEPDAPPKKESDLRPDQPWSHPQTPPAEP